MDICWAKCGGGIPTRSVQCGRAFLRLRVPKAAGDETRKGREKRKAGPPAVCAQKWDVECRRSRRGGCPLRGGPRADEALGLMDARKRFRSGFFVGLLPELSVPREPGLLNETTCVVGSCCRNNQSQQSSNWNIVLKRNWGTTSIRGDRHIKPRVHHIDRTIGHKPRWGGAAGPWLVSLL